MRKIKINKRIDDPLGGSYWIVKVIGKGPKCIKLISTLTYFDEETGKDTDTVFNYDIFLPLHRVVEENENFIIGTFTNNDLKDLDKYQYETVD